MSVFNVFCEMTSIQRRFVAAGWVMAIPRKDWIWGELSPQQWSPAPKGQEIFAEGWKFWVADAQTIVGVGPNHGQPIGAPTQGVWITRGAKLREGWLVELFGSVWLPAEEQDGDSAPLAVFPELEFEQPVGSAGWIEDSKRTEMRFSVLRDGSAVINTNGILEVVPPGCWNAFPWMRGFGYSGGWAIARIPLEPTS